MSLATTIIVAFMLLTLVPLSIFIYHWSKFKRQRMLTVDFLLSATPEQMEVIISQIHYVLKLHRMSIIAKQVATYGGKVRLHIWFTTNRKQKFLSDNLARVISNSPVVSDYAVQE